MPRVYVVDMPRERDLDPPALGRAGAWPGSAAARCTPRSDRRQAATRGRRSWSSSRPPTSRPGRADRRGGRACTPTRSAATSTRCWPRGGSPGSRTSGSTRGRPHWLYSAHRRQRRSASSPAALDAELDRASAPDVARLAAATWAEAGPDVGPADTLDAAVDAGDPGAHRLRLRGGPQPGRRRDHPAGVSLRRAGRTSTRSSATSTPSCSARCSPGPASRSRWPASTCSPARACAWRTCAVRMWTRSGPSSCRTPPPGRGSRAPAPPPGLPQPPAPRPRRQPPRPHGRRSDHDHECH